MSVPFEWNIATFIHCAYTNSIDTHILSSLRYKKPIGYLWIRPFHKNIESTYINLTMPVFVM